MAYILKFNEETTDRQNCPQMFDGFIMKTLTQFQCLLITQKTLK